MTVYRGANFHFANPHDVALLRALATGKGIGVPADVILGVEARDRADRPVNVQRILNDVEPGQWRVKQSRSSGERAGSVIAVRRGAVKYRWGRLRHHSSAAPGVQRRWARTARLNDGGPVDLYVAHNALGKTGKREEGNRSARAWATKRLGRRIRAEKRGHAPRTLTFMDANRNPDAMARDLHADDHAGADVSVMAISGDWGRYQFNVTKRVVGTDHAVITLSTADGVAAYHARMEDR